MDRCIEPLCEIKRCLDASLGAGGAVRRDDHRFEHIASTGWHGQKLSDLSDQNRHSAAPVWLSFSLVR